VRLQNEHDTESEAVTAERDAALDDLGRAVGETVESIRAKYGSVPIEKIKMGPRVRRALRILGATTMEQAALIRPEQMLAISQCAQTSVDQLKALVDAYKAGGNALKSLHEKDVLSVREATILILRANGTLFRSIASAFGIPIGTARQIAARAITKVKTRDYDFPDGAMPTDEQRAVILAMKQGG
jgi:hypothetical protein